MKKQQLTPNFNIKEFRCKDGTDVPDEYECNVIVLAQNLQILRDHLGEPITVHSGYRTPTYNASVGGASRSQHKLAKAADITVKSKTPKQLHTIILNLIKEGKMRNGGLGLYSTFVHYDIGSVRRWNG
jgi:uncharacterized protein YcbK (DUF882 family)